MLDRHSARASLSLGKIGPVALRATAAVTGGGLGVATVAAFAKNSVDAATTFDKTMRQVAAVAKLPASAIKDLREVALDMGEKTSFSARQAGDAMLELAKGGLTAAQIKAGGLKATLTLAAAGGLELGEAANFVIKSLGQFGLRVDKAGDAAAALAGGANASTANVQDLGEALAQVGPGARNAGLSLQETVAVLAAFSDNGLRGSDAGTSLKTALAALVPQTDKAAKTMHKLGLDFVDAHGAILPISEIAQQLQDRLKGLSEAQRIAALRTIFGSDATRAATVLMQEGSRGLAKYIKATHDRAAAEKLAKTNTEGAAGAFERLKGAIETVQIRFGTALLPVLADAADTFATRILPAVQKTAQQFATDLTPELGRVRLAWDQNRTSILRFATSLETGQSSMLTSKEAASGLADQLARLIAFGGDLANFGDRVAGHLNDTATSSQKSAEGLRHMLEPAARLFGLVPPENVVGFFQRLGLGADKAATATRSAATAADDHATSLRNERSALQALQGALDDEKTSELELRQAKLNVQTAQARLNTLKAQGRRGSFEYTQAQLDLERAQIDLTHKTDDYRAAQKTANAATSGAMHASQQATRAHRNLAVAADRAGYAGFLMGDRIYQGLKRIPKGRTIQVTATFGFHTPPGISMHDIVGATGGYVTSTAISPRGLHRGGMLNGPGTETSDSIPARLSKGEYVVNARAVRTVGRDTMDWINAQGFARGGIALESNFPPVDRLTHSFTRFLGVIDRSIGRLADKWDRFAGARPPHVPGGWRVATQFLSALGIPYNIISTFRPGARTHASGSLSYHALNRAVDLTGPNMLAIWSALTRTDPTELIYSRAPRYKSRRGWRPIGMLDPITRADHYSHVHAAYDRGGWLMPGTTVATNSTGRPERVLPPGHGGGDIHVIVDLRGSTVLGGTGEIANRLAPELRTRIRDAQRRAGVPAAQQLR